MNNIGDKLFSGIMGFFGGMLVTMGLLSALERSPKQMIEAWHKEAIARGHAHWVMDTNGNDIVPVIKFEWNK